MTQAAYRHLTSSATQGEFCRFADLLPPVYDVLEHGRASGGSHAGTKLWHLLRREVAMDGMHCEQHYLSDYYIDGDKHVSASWHYEFPPTPTIAQITLGDFSESNHASWSQVMVGFESCTYLDATGVTRTDSLPGTSGSSAIRVLARNGMASVTYGMRSVNCSASTVLNLFFWSNVF